MTSLIRARLFKMNMQENHVRFEIIISKNANITNQYWHTALEYSMEQKISTIHRLEFLIKF